MLRTRMVEGVERAVRWSLPPLALGLAAAAVGLASQHRAVALVPFVRTALRRPPHTPASIMLGAGTAWPAAPGGGAGWPARSARPGGILNLAWPLRVAAIDLGVTLLAAWPAGGWVSAMCWWLASLGLGSFVLLAAAALIASHLRTEEAT